MASRRLCQRSLTFRPSASSGLAASGAEGRGDRPFRRPDAARDRVDVHLTLVGECLTLFGRARDRGRGYLDKSRPKHAARLRALYAAAHLFVLPTRADCTPMVLAEAGAHGTPVLVTDTGGVGSLVMEGVTTAASSRPGRRPPTGPRRSA